MAMTEDLIIEKMLEKREKKKSKPSPIKDIGDTYVVKPEERTEQKAWDRLKMPLLKAVREGDAEKATEISLTKTEKKKVMSTLKSPEKTAKAIEKTEKAVESGKQPPKSSMSDMFTGAIMKSLPLLIGSAIGGLDVGVSAQEGANQAEADIAASRRADEEIDLKKEELKEKQFQFDATLQFKKDSEQFRADTQKQMAALKAQGASQSDLEKYIPGVGFALTKDDAKKGKDILDLTNDMASQLDELLSLRQEKGAEFLDREAVSAGKAAATNLKLKIKDAASLGVMSEQDKELLDTMIPDDPLQVDVLTDTEAQLKEVKRIYVNRLNTFFESRGLSAPQFKGNPKTDSEARARRIAELEAKR